MKYDVDFKSDDAPWWKLKWNTVETDDNQLFTPCSSSAKILHLIWMLRQVSSVTTHTQTQSRLLGENVKYSKNSIQTCILLIEADDKADFVTQAICVCTCCWLYWAVFMFLVFMSSIHLCRW